MADQPVCHFYFMHSVYNHIAAVPAEARVKPGFPDANAAAIYAKYVQLFACSLIIFYPKSLIRRCSSRSQKALDTGQKIVVV